MDIRRKGRAETWSDVTQFTVGGTGDWLFFHDDGTGRFNGRDLPSHQYHYYCVSVRAGYLGQDHQCYPAVA